ncbi:MAG: hypothetical protein HYU75_00890 [Betaproteobacteria bacterium]|nr:hypothetical protein [Betaproteobacteria bacterium]
MTTVPAKNGWIWLVQGFALFRRSPAKWLLIVLAYWMAIALLNQIPVVGALAATVLLPAFSVSFMVACDELAHKRSIGVATLAAGFRTRLAALVTMGAIYLVSILLVLWVSTLADNGTLWRWVISGKAPPESALRDGSLSSALLLAAALGTPVMMAFWFAPVLTAWQAMSAPKALFFSFFAAWRNWRAFLLYGAVLILAGIGISMLIGVIGILVAAKVLPSDVLRIAAFLVSLTALPIIFGSFYAGYCDLFPSAPGAAEPLAPVY